MSTARRAIINEVRLFSSLLTKPILPTGWLVPLVNGMYMLLAITLDIEKIGMKKYITA